MHEQLAEQAPITTISPDAGSAPRPCVLVVDDSRVIRRAMVKALSGEFELLEAGDGEDGWKQLNDNERIQVVITDMEMPKLDGYALLCRIRADEQPRVREVPVIVITGAQDEETRERAYACGATDFVTKPIDNLQLLARARAHARLDQTTRKLNETTKSLEEQTAVDPVTQLHSRRYFMQRAEQDIAYAKRRGQDMAVVRLEFDNFRAVYKQLGDDACDELFVWLANLMRDNTRTEDTPARIRGGEFAIVAPSSDRQEATTLCERLRSAINAKPFESGGVSVPVTISLGLATVNADRVDTIDDLLRHAERRLTLAKAAGGNQLGVDYGAEVPLPEEAVIEQPSIETALDMIANGDGGKLLPYLSDLLARVMPLLETCDQQLELDLNTTLHTLKERLHLVKQ